MKHRVVFLISFLLILPSCNERLDSLEAELARLKEQISSQEETVSAIQALLNSGRMIADFRLNESGDGYFLTFTDGETVRITDGKTPLITIGENGNWYVDGQDTGRPARGEKPTVAIVDGYWWVDDVNTGVKAEAEDGAPAPVIVSILDSPSQMSFMFSDGSVIKVDKALKRIYIVSEYATGTIAPGEVVAKRHIHQEEYASDCGNGFRGS